MLAILESTLNAIYLVWRREEKKAYLIVIVYDITYFLIFTDYETVVSGGCEEIQIIENADKVHQTTAHLSHLHWETGTATRKLK